MPAKPLQYSSFFKAVKHPRDWGFAEYLKFDHGNLTPRKIVDGWRKSLEAIIKSADKEFSQSHRKHAAVLLKRYKEKGKGSDSAYGRGWLAEKNLEQKSSSVHIGAVFQGPISNSLVPIAQASESSLPVHQINHVDSNKDVEQATLVENSDSEGEGAESPVPGEANSSTPLSFRNSYNDMREECKWVLASGRIVEDVIFEACRAMDTESFRNSLAQSFVLDTSDTVMKGWFTDDEWKEIVGSVLLLPKPDVVLADSMKRFFQIKSTATLREALDKHGYLPDGVGYDAEVHFNSQWADVVIRRFLMLLEAPGEPLRMSHLEDWYSSYIWSSILDDCLLNLAGMTMERKESPCRATSIRKNRNRVRINRMKIGSRLDGIIRTVEDDYYEYGAVEVARTFNGVTSTKWLGDSFKLAKALRDMLFRLHKLVGNDQSITKRLQVVGVATAGLSFQYVRMNHPSGYVCLLQREKLQQVPKAVHDLPVLMHLLMNVAQMKQLVRDCAAAVEERHVAKTEFDLYEELIGGNTEDQGRLGWALDTP